jgi:hypothetical protein
MLMRLGVALILMLAMAPASADEPSLSWQIDRAKGHPRGTNIVR